MVKSFQDMYFDGRNQSTKKGYSCPSFSKLAAAYGIAAHKVRNDDEFRISINRIKDHKGPLLIELIMKDATECRPRLAFGRKLDEQLPAFDLAPNAGLELQQHKFFGNIR